MKSDRKTIFSTATIAALALFGQGLMAESVSPVATDVNTALDIPLFSQEKFWEESASAIAERLRWPQESQTSDSASYRSYKPLDVLGSRAYSMVLHAENDKPAALSFVFANKGDIDAMIEVDADARESQQRRAQQQVMRNYKRIIDNEGRVLREKLTGIFGESSRIKTGASSQTSELSYRWDWEGSSFLLASPRGEYVTLRIVPSEGLDESGIERVHRKDLLETLSSRIERRPNGDVIITDIPMVDQGPKGYCVPATWERVLRYTGIPADMYILAMAGNTQVGGGTSTAGIMDGARQLVQRYGRRINSERGKLSIRNIARSIDKGIPLMWTMFSTQEFNDIANSRTKQRAAVTDWEVWKNETLSGARKNARNMKPDRDSAHVCMIIGYNADTGEIAVSDSWGPTYAERWVLVEEAEAVSQGETMFIQP
jgi:hypothetical protein